MEQGLPKTLDDANASDGINTFRWRLITITPNGLVPGYEDGRRKGTRWIAGINILAEGVTQVVDTIAIGGIHDQRSRIQYTVHSRRDSASTRTKDNLPRDSYHVQAVGGGLETAIAELTKKMEGLTQEVRGMKNRLNSIDSRLAKVETWEGRLIKIEGRLGSVERTRSSAR